MGCRHYNANRSRTCELCKFPLLTLEALNEQIGGSAVKLMAKQTRPFRVKLPPLSYSGASSSSANQTPGPLAAIPNMQKVVLPIQHVNPASKNAQNQIKASISTTHGVRTDSLQARMWMAIICDLGAVNEDEVVADKFTDIMLWFCWGHYEMACDRLMLKIMFVLSGLDFCEAYGFKKSKTNAAAKYLMSGKDHHFAFDYLQLMMEAFNEEFLKQWLLERNNVDPTNHIDDYRAWLKEDHGDKMWANYVYFYTEVLPDYFLVRKGLRSTNYYMVNAARRSLLGLFFKLGFSTYAPLTLWEMLRTDYRCPEPVKRFYAKYTCLKGQGPDFDIEEDIQRITRGNRKLGQKGYEGANAACATNQESWSHVAQEAGLKERKRMGRRPLDRENDKKAFTQIILKYDVLRKVPGRLITTSIDVELGCNTVVTNIYRS